MPIKEKQVEKAFSDLLIACNDSEILDDVKTEMTIIGKALGLTNEEISLQFENESDDPDDDLDDEDVS